MRDALASARRFAFSWRGDLLLAVIMVPWILTAAVVTAAHGVQRLPALVTVTIAYSAAIAIRRDHPMGAAVLACAALLALRPFGVSWVLNGPAAIPFMWTPFLLAYGLGTGAGVIGGLLGVALLSVALQVGNRVFNPIIAAFTIGPWLVGRIAVSRRRLNEQLRARNQELLAEQELFAQESVRYERARIARELHDIVAHCLSVMVVQASAGQRVPDADRDGMAEALASVAEAAVQAQEEIGRLVELLGGDLPGGAQPTMAMVQELVRRAATTGLDVTCRFAGDCGELSASASETAYRVVQEALTNALKHAPGAPVTVTVGPSGSHVAIRVVNSAPGRPASGLEQSGAQYGLTAMRDRVTACGGTLSAGPMAGGWQVLAVLPASLAAKGGQSPASPAAHAPGG
jgi:signal transduction histidine kinase